ncbi:MAG TPA: hypothetical protein VM848_04625 [Acidimicrobiia bacterium]|nr:hypothetical protein [Acidimicrobiia bacterium]
MTALDAWLGDSAGKYAKRALEAFVTGDLGDFVLFGGVAIEHAVKTKLAREHPTFLAARDSFSSVIALHRATDANRIPSGTKTVGAREAMVRLFALYPELKAEVEPAQEILALRNGEAHMGAGDETQRRRVLVTFLRAIQALLVMEPGDFWQPHYDLVKTSLDDRAVDVDREVATRMANARISFGKLVEAQETAYQTPLLGLAESRRDSLVDRSDNLPIDCPVCGSPAILSGVTNETGFETSEDSDGVVDAWPVLTFFAERLACELCGLKLDEVDQIRQAGVGTSFRNDDISLEEWVAMNYHDEDHDF